MKRLVLSIIITSFCLIGYSNDELTQNIRGKITDEVTGSPITGATVILLGTDPVYGTTSDINGEFELSNVPIGRQSIEISFVGYETVNINNILLNSGKEVILDIGKERKCRK